MALAADPGNIHNLEKKSRWLAGFKQRPGAALATKSPCCTSSFLRGAKGEGMTSEAAFC